MWTILGDGPRQVFNSPSKRTTKSTYICRCDCGTERVVLQQNIKRGASTHCGCAARKTHGGSKSKLYGVWRGMHQRIKAETVANACYAGILICAEWSSFESFRDWALSNGYAEGLTLDREKSTGNYCPENCRWVTMHVQDRNKKNNVFLTHKGRTQILGDWAYETGIHKETIRCRLKRGWSIDKALETPCHM